MTGGRASVKGKGGGADKGLVYPEGTKGRFGKGSVEIFLGPLKPSSANEYLKIGAGGETVYEGGVVGYDMKPFKIFGKKGEQLVGGRARVEEEPIVLFDKGKCVSAKLPFFIEVQACPLVEGKGRHRAAYRQGPSVNAAQMPLLFEEDKILSYRLGRYAEFVYKGGYIGSALLFNNVAYRVSSFEG